MHSNEIEAANRAEVTAILIRLGYRVYRPEADVKGVDLVIRTSLPEDELVAVQMKSRPTVNGVKYGGRKIWMLFPDPDGDIPGRRWFLVRHDELFAWWKKRHGASPGWDDTWHEGHVSDDLNQFLQQFELVPVAARPRQT